MPNFLAFLRHSTLISLIRHIWGFSKVFSCLDHSLRFVRMDASSSYWYWLWRSVHVFHRHVWHLRKTRMYSVTGSPELVSIIGENIKEKTVFCVNKSKWDLPETCNSELRVDYVIYSHFDNRFVKKIYFKDPLFCPLSLHNISYVCPVWDSSV